MFNLKEYIDYHASRWSHPETLRGRDHLHALRNLAQWLYIIEQRRALGQVYVNGCWTAPQQKGR